MNESELAELERIAEGDRLGSKLNWWCARVLALIAALREARKQFECSEACVYRMERDLRAQLARLTLTEGDRELLREIRADWEINKAAVTLLDRLLASGTGET